MKKGFVKSISVITAFALLLSAVSGMGIWKQVREARALNVVLENPLIQPDATMVAQQKVTWDCVYFGSYPQAEVVTSAAAYSALDANLYDAGMDILSDSTLYAKLENAEGWQDNELVLDGVKYRRMRSEDADGYRVTDAVKPWTEGYYQWSDTTTYHYFKYENIKWRVLSTDGKQALLLSDISLDNRYYNDTDVNWESCLIRSWLNGYAATQNSLGINYKGQGFVNRAFNQNEAEAIMEAKLTNEPGNTTQDKIFLLSREEFNTTAYGFKETSVRLDEARRSHCSTYAKAMGVQVNANKFCGQTLRSIKRSEYDYIGIRGTFEQTREPSQYVPSNRISYYYAIRPALYLDLTKGQCTFAGTVCSNGEAKDAKEVEAARATASPTPILASASPSSVASGSPSPTPTGSGNVTQPPYGTQSPVSTPSPTPTPTVSASAGVPTSTPTASASTVVPTPTPTASVSAVVPTPTPTASASAVVPTPTASAGSVVPSPTAPGGVLVVQTPAPGKNVYIEKTVYKGKRFNDADTQGKYKITKTGENGTVIYLRPLDKTQKSVIIPDEVEYKDNTYRVVAVGEHAFYKNKKLRRITLGDNVTKISNRAFYKCTNLEEINFNKKLKRIGTKAFFRCNSLEEIVLPSKVEHIGVRAFYKCKNLRRAVLSRNMLELGTKSFYQCKKLNLDMRKVKNRHIAMGRKPFTGVKRVRYGNVQTRP